MGNVHPTALVSSGADLGADVMVGPFSIVNDGVHLGDRSVVGSHCVLGEPTPLAAGEALYIGQDSLIRSHSVLYAGSSLGPGFVTGHRVTVREGTVVGAGVQIGTLSDLQGDCVLGDYVRLHSNVHVGKGSEVGDFVWLFPYVVLTNDPHPPSDVRLGCSIGSYAVVATMSVVLPGVTLGEGCLVGAHSLVNRDVEAGHLVAGVPAKVRGLASEVRLQDGSGRPAYPWTSHFSRGYPDDAIQRWGGNEARA